MRYFKFIIILLITVSCVNHDNSKKKEIPSNEDFTEKVVQSKTSYSEIVLKDHQKIIVTTIDSVIYTYNNGISEYRIINQILRLDSVYNDFETSKSILIEKDHEVIDTIYINETFTLNKFISGEYDNYGMLPWREVVCSPISKKDSREIVRLDFEYFPSAPGGKHIALIEFNENKHLTSMIINLYMGGFKIIEDKLFANYWTGYFSIIIPFNIISSVNEILFEVDTSQLNFKGNYILFEIEQKNIIASSSDSIIIVEDIFTEEKIITKVSINKGEQVELKSVAVINTNFKGFNEKGIIEISPMDSTFIDLWEYGFYWLNFSTESDTGWTRSQQHYMIFGLQAAG